jgi:hypothetical protein
MDRESVQVQVVALIAARLLGLFDSGSRRCTSSCKAFGLVVRIRCRRHCKVSLDGENLSHQVDGQRSGSSGSCRRFSIVRGDSKGNRKFTSSGGDGDLS